MPTKLLRDVERSIIYDERRLQRAVFRRGKVNANGLAFVREYVEGFLRVAGCSGQVRVSCERRN